MLQRYSRAMLLVAGILAGAISIGRPAATPASASTVFPAGPKGADVAYGYKLFTNTAGLLPHNVRAALSCQSCHLGGGRTENAFPLTAAYATYPRYLQRAKSAVTIEMRISECFLRSLNGIPPAATSREMAALTAYLAFLSNGEKVGAPATPPPNIVPAARWGDAQRGKLVYAQNCSMCHGEGGAGIAGAMPPVWGPRSFNTGAGMAHPAYAAAWIRANMPLGKAGSLSAQEALDVASFIDRQPRPVFDAGRSIVFPGIKASAF